MAQMRVLRKKTDQMLATKPNVSATEQVDLHQKLQPLTSRQLEKYAASIDREFSCLDPNVAEFEEWQDDSGEKHIGMRHKDSKKRHGIRRFVTVDGRINEGTSKDGSAHGLLREVTKTKVTYCLCKDGTYLAQVGFDKDLAQIWKVDPQNLLTDVTAERIRRR